MDRVGPRNRRPHTLFLAAVAILLATATMTILSCDRGHGPLNIGGRGVAALEGDFTRIAAQTLPSVVSISCEVTPRPISQAERQVREWFEQHDFPGPPTPDTDADQRATSVGSGWIYSPDGFIITNAHVVRDASRIMVELNDRPGESRQHQAQLWATDPRSELAVIKVDPGRSLPTLKLGDSERLAVGSWVMAVGSPFALQQTVTVGVVSAKGRLLPGEDDYITIGDVIQTDASINIGNSGGPLVNLRGEVVGINVAIASPTAGSLPVSVGIGFAIPAATAAHVVPKLISQRTVPRGWLGVAIEDLSPNMREFFSAPEGGALVNRIFNSAPAATSDLREDDVIVAVNGTAISSPWDLQKAISLRPPGATVSLRIIREGVQKSLTTTLGHMPAKYTGQAEQGERDAPARTEFELGLELKPIDAKLKDKLELHREHGVVVTQVKAGSAARGKLHRGDVIVWIDGDPIQKPEDCKQAVEKAVQSDRGYILIRAERTLNDGEVTLVTADIPLTP